MFEFEKMKIERKIELEERLINDLIEKLLEERKRLEEIEDKTMRNKTFGKLYIEKIKLEILNEIKLLEETEEKLMEWHIE